MKYIPKLQNGKTIVQQADATKTTPRLLYNKPIQKLNTPQDFAKAAEQRGTTVTNSLIDLGGKPTEKKGNYWDFWGGRLGTNLNQLGNLGMGVAKTVGASAALANGMAYTPATVGTLGALGKGLLSGAVVDQGYSLLGGRPANTEEIGLGAGATMGIPLVGKGMIKGGKILGEYLLEKSRPYLLGDKRIPMIGYKPKQEFWNPFSKEIKGNFKSEINWGNWNKEIPSNKPLMDEYLQIEKTAKQNGTWMKNPDGTDFPGTPEQFVQQNSSNFKNAFGNTKVLVNGRPQILTHNSPDIFSEFSLNKVNNRRLSGDGVYTFEEGALWKGMPEYLKKAIRYPAKIDQSKYGKIEYHLYGNSTNPKIGKGQFDDITKDIVIDSPTSTRVIDNINRKNIHVFPNTNQLKSARGNNGMFDMTNPNIYKGIIPAIGTYELTKNKKE